MRFSVLILALVVVSGCSDGGGPVPTPKELIGAATEGPTPTEESAEPSPTDPPTAKPLSVKVTKRTKSVRRNSTASVTIKTSKGARCSIDVQYSSGSATAKGLDSKKANSSGGITWKWKVGSNTTRGTWPIDIWCELGDRSGSVSTEFKVT